MGASVKIVAVDTWRNTPEAAHVYDEVRTADPRKGWHMVEQKGNKVALTDTGRVAALGVWLSLFLPLGTLAWNSGAGYRSITDANARAIEAAQQAKDATARNATLIADLAHQIEAQRAEDSLRRREYDQRMHQMEDDIVGLGSIVGKLAARTHVQPGVSCCITGKCRYGQTHCNAPAPDSTEGNQ